MKVKRVKTSYERKSYERQFQRYKENYRKKKEQYNIGELEENDFVSWIESQKISNKN